MQKLQKQQKRNAYRKAATVCTGILTNVCLCVQVEIHPFFRNDRVVEWCKEQGIHVTGYAPLSSPQTMKKDGRDMPNLLQVCFWLFVELLL